MSAVTATLSTCLAKMWVITHETSLQAFVNLGQTPSVWSGGNVVEMKYSKRQLRGHQDKYKT